MEGEESRAPQNLDVMHNRNGEFHRNIVYVPWFDQIKDPKGLFFSRELSRLQPLFVPYQTKANS